MSIGIGIMVHVDFKIALGCVIFVMGNWIDDKTQQNYEHKEKK